jgi:cytochrome c
MKTAFIAAAPTALFVACFASSFIHPWGNPRSGVDPKASLLRGTEMPTNVERVFETKCSACHSEKTAWPGYSRFAPASWLIERDVIEGRAHLNMSRWQDYTSEARIDLLSRIASEARSGEMPVRQYLVLHPKAKLSPEEQQLIYDWAKLERKQIRQQLARAQARP